jgi:predicted transcriptional regulator
MWHNKATTEPMTDQLDATLTMRIPVELKARLRAEADKHWLKPSDIARIAIRDFLDSESGTTESQANHEESEK